MKVEPNPILTSLNSFPRMREKDCLYVDKTDMLHAFKESASLGIGLTFNLSKGQRGIEDAVVQELK